jgi:putative ABC transport system ATP-binding protein
VEFRKKNVAFVFQSYYLIPTLNVYSNIKMAANLNGNKDFRNVIESLGLRGKEKKMPALLSGGEQQRVAIARAIAKEPTILFCDEPTGALDEATGRQVMSILLDLNKKGMTIVMVTHNENLARITSNIIRMNSGNIVSNNKNVPVKLEEIKW